MRRAAETKPDAPVRPDTWFEATRLPWAPRPELDFTAEVDVCVIGAGLAGLHVAHEIASRGWSVAVLEARTIGANASGRNSGLVSEGFTCPAREIEAAVGAARAKALWKLSREAVNHVRSLIETVRMPGIALEPGIINVSRLRDIASFRFEADRMAETYGARGIFWNTDRLRTTIRSGAYFAGLHDAGAFQIHPLNYCFGLAQEAARLGVRIYEGSPATSIDLRSIRRRVTTARGAVRCDQVVIAGSALLAPLFPRVSRAITPITNYSAVTEPLGSSLASLIQTEAAVRETRRNAAQFRIVGGDRLLWSGRSNAVPVGLDKARARLRADMIEVFPELKAAKFDYCWGAVLGIARHRMPQIGEVAPRVWVSSAHGDHGINATAVAGSLLAKAIVERDDSFRLFEAFGMTPTYGLIGRIKEQVALWRNARLNRDEEA